jgi:hypothetical protein
MAIYVYIFKDPNQYDSDLVPIDKRNKFDILIRALRYLPYAVNEIDNNYNTVSDFLPGFII